MADCICERDCLSRAHIYSSVVALGDGDSFSLNGPLTPKVWTSVQGEPKPAMDLVCHAVLSAYHVTRKRQVMANKASEGQTFDMHSYKAAIAPLE